VISCPVGDRKTAELAAEAVDQATLQPEVVLRRAVEVSVKVVELECAQRKMAGQGDIAPPPMADAKALLEPEPKPTGQRRSVLHRLALGRTGIYVRGSSEYTPWDKQVANFVGRGAGRQAGYFAPADLADNADVRCKIGSAEPDPPWQLTPSARRQD